MSDRPGHGLAGFVFRRRVVVPLWILGMGGICGLLTNVALRGDQTTPEGSLVRPNPSEPGDSRIHALARLEPASGLIAVGVRPGLRVEEVRVKEGDEIKAGTLLAILEGHSQAQRQLELAEAQKKSADDRRSLQREKVALAREREDGLKSARHDTAEQVAKLTRQKFQQLTALEKTLSALIEKDAKTKYEIQQAAYQLEVAALRAELELKELDTAEALKPRLRALEDRELADNGPDSEILARQIDIARAALAQTEVHSTGSGLVLEILARPGEVSSGSLLTLGDLTSMVAKAEVYQSDVGRLALGDAAKVLMEGQPVTGKVTKIGRLVGSNEFRGLDPRALQDLRVVSVTIALDDGAEASKYVRRQVDVTIKPSQRATR